MDAGLVKTYRVHTNDCIAREGESRKYADIAFSKYFPLCSCL